MKNALIVEDNLILSILYENYLNKMIFKTVGQIKQAERAVELVKRYKPDVVIMDINLEGDMDGIEAAKEIRKFSDVPVLFITGSSDPYNMNRAEQVPNSDYLFKPISEPLLKKAVKQLTGEPLVKAS